MNRKNSRAKSLEDPPRIDQWRSKQIDELGAALRKLRSRSLRSREPKALQQAVEALCEIVRRVDLIDRHDNPNRSDRRKPWLAFEVLDQSLDSPPLISTVNAIVEKLSTTFAALRKGDSLILYNRGDYQRLGELVKASKKHRLDSQLLVTDPQILSRYCSKGLATLYRRKSRGAQEAEWKAWGKAMFLDIWHDHRGGGADYSRAFGKFRDFVYSTLNQYLLDMLHQAVPSETFAEVNQVRQARKQEKERTRAARNREK